MKVAIVEDEIPAAQRLERLLKKVDSSIEVVALVESLEESLEYFKDPPSLDFVFLDISLGDGDSFELLEQRDIDVPIIFVTAFNDRSLDAFRYLTVDYLLKPIKRGALERALSKYKTFFTQKQDSRGQEIIEGNRHLIEIGGRYKVVPYDQVAYYFMYNSLASLMTFTGKKYPVSMSLDEVEQKCVNLDYFRINRQYIIHRKAIENLKKTTKSRLRVSLDPPPPQDEKPCSSTQRSPAFKKWLQGK
jgi:two-component system LytT family response regulator